MYVLYVPPASFPENMTWMTLDYSSGNVRPFPPVTFIGPSGTCDSPFPSPLGFPKTGRGGNVASERESYKSTLVSTGPKKNMPVAQLGNGLTLKLTV